ncbi:DUF362 domain-containing protein [Magnetofaba australis]|uniref:Putative cytoplasmic protein n=1 Tax=Magnetofaba australis IT-1 TaxID=1434232 RepID=A0A1Y2K524_9PROT|nr:DUF362 domain-containing protein [Magnetofaba australis]OSM04425.1 putative cytoplasmic protein [Magnetofaba australis IT-1]
MSEAETPTPRRRKKQHSIHDRVVTPQSRRDFLRHTAVTAGLAVGAVGIGLAYRSDQPIARAPKILKVLPDFRVDDAPQYPKLAIIRGQDVPRMTRAAVAQLGGIDRFIKKGDRVVIKPNVGWDRQPEQAANTRPELVAAMVMLCREAGAASVTVTDVSLNDPRRCFFRSGIQAAAQEAGADVWLPGNSDFIDTDMGGKLLTEWPVAAAFHEADKLINLPIVKNHSLCHATLAMKNHYGMIGGRRNQLHQDIHQSIVDLAAAAKPTLTVMDATRVLMRNGPTGGSLADVSIENTLIAGTDEVAMDSFALGFLKLESAQLNYLAMGEARGLGVVDWKSLNPREEQVG